MTIHSAESPRDYNHRTYPSPLARDMHYWRIKQQIDRGAFTVRQIAEHHGYTEGMVRYICQTARQPDLHGLTEQDALAASAAGVPLRVAAHLIATHTTDTTNQQGAAVGLHEKTIRKYRAALYRAGLLHITASVYAQANTHARQQLGRVLRLLRSGQGVCDVMAATGLSKPYIYEMCEPYGGVSHIRDTSQAMSLLQAATLLGIAFDTLRLCIDAGYLVVGRHQRSAPGANDAARTRYCATHVDTTRFWVSRADVFDFLRERAAWPRYSVHTIRDQEFKAYAMLHQRTAGGAWRSRNEIAEMMGIHKETAAKYIKRGWLREWETTIYGRVTYYWHPNGVAIPQWKASRS